MTNVLFPHLTLADGLHNGNAGCGEAVEDGDADFKFGGLTVEISGHEPSAE